MPAVSTRHIEPLLPVAAAGPTDHEQPIDDTLSLADSLSSQAALLRSVADTLTLADSASPASRSRK